MRNYKRELVTRLLTPVHEFLTERGISTFWFLLPILVLIQCTLYRKYYRDIFFYMFKGRKYRKRLRQERRELKENMKKLDKKARAHIISERIQDKALKISAFFLVILVIVAFFGAFDHQKELNAERKQQATDSLIEE